MLPPTKEWAPSRSPTQATGLAADWARTEEAVPSDPTAGGRLQSDDIVGNVVLKSDGKGLARARILGIPENPKASYVTAVADEQGHFHVPRVRSAMLLLAQNGDRTLSGLSRIEPDEPNVVISVQSPVNVRGRLLNWKGQPLGPWPLEYCLVVDGTSSTNITCHRRPTSSGCWGALP